MKNVVEIIIGIIFIIIIGAILVSVWLDKLPWMDSGSETPFYPEQSIF